MSEEILAYSRAHHPGPYRARVSFAALLCGLFAAPIVWAGNLMVGYALAAHACYPGDTPLFSPVGYLHYVWPLVLACHLFALVLIAGGWLVAYRNWRVTGPPESHHHHLLERGEDRTRYFGIVGMGFATMFFMIVAGQTIAMGLIPPCLY